MNRLSISALVAAAFVLGLVVSSPGWQEEKTAKVQKWEIRKAASWDTGEKFGDEGWELVGASRGINLPPEYYFKRPKQ